MHAVDQSIRFPGGRVGFILIHGLGGTPIDTTVFICKVWRGPGIPCTCRSWQGTAAPPTS